MSDFLAKAVDKHTDRLNKWHVLLIVLIIAILGYRNHWSTLVHGGTTDMPNSNMPLSYANTIQRNS